MQVDVFSFEYGRVFHNETYCTMRLDHGTVETDDKHWNFSPMCFYPSTEVDNRVLEKKIVKIYWLFYKNPFRVSKVNNRLPLSIFILRFLWAITLCNLYGLKSGFLCLIWMPLNGCITVCRWINHYSVCFDIVLHSETIIIRNIVLHSETIIIKKTVL